MIGFIKKIFSHAETPPAQAPGAAAPAPAKPETAHPASAASKPAPAQSASAPKAAPPQTPAAPAQPKAPASAAPVAEGDVIKIPLADIVAKLPANLAPPPSATVTGTYSLPVKTALTQLPTGSVRVRFGDIRQAAPPGVFTADGAADETMVALPLQKILSSIRPDMLARRSDQKQIEVPPEVTGVFGGRQGMAAPVASAAPKAAPAAPVAEPKSATPAPVSEPKPAPVPEVKAAPPASAPALAPVVPAKPIAPVPTPIVPTPIAPTPIAPSPTPISPIAATAPSAPSLPKPSPKPPSSIASPPSPPKAPASSPLPFATQKPSPAPAPVAPAAPVAAAPSPIAPAPAPAAPKPAGGPAVTVKISVISEAWAEPVRQEIAQANASDASVAIPVARLDAAMKTGKVIFKWGELIGWLESASSLASSPNKETPLQLPLKVIIPLFMAQRTATEGQKKVVIGENIPNLFEGLSKPVQEAAAPAPLATEPETVSTTTVEATTSTTIPSPEPEAVTSATIRESPTLSSAPTLVAPPASILGGIFGQPAKKDWSPLDIAQNLGTLPGVGAGIIAMSDGLLVAGDLPPPLQAETLAAFLPQMFGRMSHYANEMQLGALSILTLQAGQTPCAIYKTGTLYLAVLGKPGETLPDALLQKVAGELAKSSQ